MNNLMEKYYVGSDNFVKNISSEIIRDCGKIDILLDENVVKLAVRLLSQDPSNGLNLDAQVDRRSLEPFVAKCVKKFQDKTNSSVKTLNMQSFFMVHSIDTDRIVCYQTELIKQKSIKLTQEILTSDNKNQDEEKFVKKMVIDNIINNSLGNPSNTKIIQDVSNALKSIMSKNDITSFLTLKPIDRYESLLNLRAIICGIYIFNNDSGFYGDRMIDVETLILSGYSTTKSQLNISMNEIQNRINLLSTILCKFITTTTTQNDDTTTKMNRNRNQNGGDDRICLNLKVDEFLIVDEEQYQQLCDVLIMQRQHEYYIKCLNRSLTNLKIDIDNCLKLFKEILHDIHETVKFRTAIPTDKIFPRFTNLANCWSRLQSEIYVLTEINIVNDRLMQLSDEIHPWEEMAYDLLGGNQIESDEQRLEKQQTVAGHILQINNEIKIVEYTTKMKIEYLGFCTMTLVKGQGLLLPANFSIGICCYKDRYYSFQSKAAAVHFQKNPDKYIFNIIEVARNHPQLIVFLDIFDDVKRYRSEYHRVESQIVKRISNDVDTQTELHPIPQRIDNSYTWNVWDMRRKAIQLANLIKSKTTSSQTDVMYQRYGVKTQTVSTRSANCQTMSDKSTNVPRPQTFLRFNQSNESKIIKTAGTDPMEQSNTSTTVNLTLPIDL